MKIKYNRGKCMSCGICVSEASNIWTLSIFDGKADLLDSEQKNEYFYRVLWPEEEIQLRKMEKACPTKAIYII